MKNYMVTINIYDIGQERYDSETLYIKAERKKDIEKEIEEAINIQKQRFDIERDIYYTKEIFYFYEGHMWKSCSAKYLFYMSKQFLDLGFKFEKSDNPFLYDNIEIIDYTIDEFRNPKFKTLDEMRKK